ncbi:MAG: hypothetical protein ACK47E_12415 [Cyclobacteriaceae bacterium]
MKSIKHISLIATFLLAIVVGCKDEKLNPYVAPLGNAHGFGQFISQLDNTTLLPQFGNNQFYDQTAVDRAVFFDDALTSPGQKVNFQLQWQSIDNKVKITTIELYLEYDETYTDADRNPQLARHGGPTPAINPSYPPGKFWKSVPAGEARVSQRLDISANDVYEVFKNNTFKYDANSSAVNIFSSHPYNGFTQSDNGYSFDRSGANGRFKRARTYTLPSGNVALAADVFRINWRLIAEDGSAYGTWSAGVCSSVVGATCFGQWRVVRDVFNPAVTFAQRGQWGPVVSGTRQRPVVGLANGARDTINIVFNREIAAGSPPSVALSAATSGWATVGSPVSYTTNDGIANNSWYVPVVATATGTGNARLVVTGAVSTRGDAMVTGSAATRDFAVDNTAPEVVSRSWSATRLGRGQSTTLTLNFNEPMSARTQDSVWVQINGQNIDDLGKRRLTLATDGRSGTYIFFYRDSSNPTDATTGALTVTYGGGRELPGGVFGNPLDLTSITAGGLRTDVSGLDGTLTPIANMDPPNPPTVTFPADFDQKTQLKWSFGVSSPVNKSHNGTVFYIVVAAGTTLPATFQRTLVVQGVTTWNGYNTAGISSSSIIAQGSISLNANLADTTLGGTGTIFTDFTSNGTYDLYAYWVSSTGNISRVSGNLGPFTTTP